MHTYTGIELRRAYALLPHKPAGIVYADAMRNPLYRQLVEARAAADRQLRRDLARRAEQARAGRWLDATANQAHDAYELTDRDAHLGEVPA